jgi:hypothetical protein
MSRARIKRFLGLGVLIAIHAGAACGGSKNDVDIPGEQAHEAGAPDASMPDTSMPDASMPDASAPDAISDVAVSDVAIVDVAIVDASSDTSVDAPTEAAVDSGIDASIDSGMDAAPDATPDASLCPLPDLTDTDRHVYVDKTVPAPGNGSLACPFKTILQATAAAAAPPAGSALTIHVKGTGTIYDEIAPVVIGDRTTLTSSYPPDDVADPSLVTIRAQGICDGAKCVVEVTAGTLDGLTIVAPNGSSNVHGVLGSAYPKIRNTTVQNASGSGILVSAGGAEIGPGVYSNGNDAQGLLAVMATAGKGAGPTLRVIAGGRGNRFNGNGTHGIHVTNLYGQVEIGEARASDNGNNGVYIEPEANTTHKLEKIEARGNSIVGLRAPRGPLSVAGGVFDQNGIHGVYFGNGGNNGVKFAIVSASASDNGIDGVRLDTSDSVEIEELTARGNGKSANGSGVLVGLGTSLRIRKSILLGNTVGLSFNQQRTGGGAAQTTLDVGTSASDLGGNTFGATPTTGNNTKAGLCILRSGAASSQKAIGNAWTTCPVTQTLITGAAPDCYDGAVYSDVAFVPHTAGNLAPVDTGATNAPECTIGVP